MTWNRVFLYYSIGTFTVVQDLILAVTCSPGHVSKQISHLAPDARVIEIRHCKTRVAVSTANTARTETTLVLRY